MHSKQILKPKAKLCSVGLLMKKCLYLISCILTILGNRFTACPGDSASQGKEHGHLTHHWLCCFLAGQHWEYLLSSLRLRFLACRRMIACHDRHSQFYINIHSFFLNQPRLLKCQLDTRIPKMKSPFPASLAVRCGYVTNFCPEVKIEVVSTTSRKFP